MVQKPSPLFIILALAFIAYINYVFYQIWFKSNIFLDSNRQRIYKLPNWYPFKNYYLARISNGKHWLIEMKIVSIIFEIFALLLVVVICLSWVVGS